MCSYIRMGISWARYVTEAQPWLQLGYFIHYIPPEVGKETFVHLTTKRRT
jgi:hypothetical protein